MLAAPHREQAANSGFMRAHPSVQSITAAYVREVLIYESESGAFLWRARMGNVAAGSVAGYISNLGYRRIGLCGKYHMAHRLAWLYVHGEWPSQHIDHINGSKADNRIANLRDVDRFTNLQNQKHAHAGSACGLLGVVRRGDRFEARIVAAGKRTHLGTFDTALQAHSAYMRAKETFHRSASL